MIFTAIFSAIVICGIGGSILASFASLNRRDWVKLDRALARAAR